MNTQSQHNPHIPLDCQVIERIQESSTVFTLRLSFTGDAQKNAYRFQPGQFNMLYLYGVGEVAISIVSDPLDEHVLDHTIRAVGRVTKALSKLQAGDHIGIRGPYGRGWPLESAKGKDVVLLTGGLGCAPVVSVINYVMNRLDSFGKLVIIQGVKHADDLIWRNRYEEWQRQEDTQVLLSADVSGGEWPWYTGRVTTLLDKAEFDKNNCTIMMCGPHVMLQFSVQELLLRGVSESDIWVSTERNMQCGLGQCGHCQYGGHFVCKHGPVFPYTEIKTLFGQEGF